MLLKLKLSTLRKTKTWNIGSRGREDGWMVGREARNVITLLNTKLSEAVGTLFYSSPWEKYVTLDAAKVMHHMRSQFYDKTQCF